MEKLYYSNCLFEAIKAKLKDWKNIEIKIIPRRLNVSNTNHFYWVNKSTKDIFDFSFDDSTSKKGLLYPYLYKGRIYKVDESKHNKLLNVGVKRSIRNLEKKLNFKSDYSSLVEMSKTLDWELYDDSLEESYFKENNKFPYVLGLYESGDTFQVKLYYIKKDFGLENPDNDKIHYWKKLNISVPYL